MRCDHVGASFRQGPDRIGVLRDVSFSVSPGEFVSVIGPSGCGKTTLLRVIGGIIRPESGKVETAGKVRTVFQENSLFPWMTVIENAAFGLEMEGMARAEREQRALELLHRFGFRGRERAYPHQLSVGMKQRVAVIRCFLTQPDLMLMDEPFGALDALTRLTLQEELLALWERDRKTVIFVTHDLDEAIRLSDRILVMAANPGRIIADHVVTLPRPRPLALISEPQCQQLKNRILEQLGVHIGSLTRV